jgi:putative sterol carrier protein
MSLATATADVQTKASNADPLGGSLKFAFNGGEGVVLIDSQNQVSNDNVDADCTINIDLEVFEAILSGDENPIGAFMGGKMQVEGDMSLAMKLQSLF